jgi:hypothetical protein
MGFEPMILRFRITRILTTDIQDVKCTAIVPEKK